VRSINVPTRYKPKSSKRMPDLPEPQAIRAVLDNGIEFGCALKFDGWETTAFRPPSLTAALRVQTTRFRRYVVMVEVPWERIPNIVRFDIVGWPDDVVFTFEVPGMTDAECVEWGSTKEFRELPRAGGARSPT
jgi:hypothetical protein